MSQDILLTLIDADPEQPRRFFDPAALAELAQSIGANGQAVPILLRPGADGRYIIVHGERRYRAVQSLGWAAIRAEVRDMTPGEARWLALAENVQRADLTPIEEADAYRAALADGITQTELGRRLGKTQSYIATKLRLLKLPEDVRQAVDAGAITEGHAKQLLRLTGEAQQSELAQRAVAEDWTVQRLKLEVDTTLTPHRETAPQTPAELVRYFFRQNGSIPKHDSYPEERLPDVFTGPVAVKRLPLADIVDEPGLYCRAPVSEGGTAYNTEWAAWLAEIFDVLPPIAVFDIAGRYHVVDGRHRLMAANLLGVSDIECRIYAGDYRTALHYAAAANAANGLEVTKDQWRRRMNEPRFQLFISEKFSAGPQPPEPDELEVIEADIECNLADLRNGAAELLKLPAADVAAWSNDRLAAFWAERFAANGIAKAGELRDQLDKATTVGETVDVIRTAAALQNDMAEVTLHCERRAGKLLEQLEDFPNSDSHKPIQAQT